MIRLITLLFQSLWVNGLSHAAASGSAIPPLQLSVGAGGTPEQTAVALKIVALLTILGLAPSLLIMLTSFVRIVIVMSFLRQAIGTQVLPPNQLIIALSMFLTVFIMAPVWKGINQDALQPYLSNKISQMEALKYTESYVRKFMFKQTRDKDLGLFVKLAGLQTPDKRADVPTYILIPAFMISELKTAFYIGFMIYIPFLVLDMVVAAILMAMGMMMLPPVVISLPFKLILFVLVDGWQLIVGSLVKSFG
ncbi:MAG: flagellar biosynthetic protein FliP [Proteobacteria bacterium]|nr:flagellar biosynthetic protein FliP [Pseudomonadota bacterium]NDD05492.1 flagellar biosynthetic protein FliP [Pseudomonadota bacterium]NDG25622.1 flagellar biosynthetic protein FliP [Pseudomonadota bacterium]